MKKKYSASKIPANLKVTDDSLMSYLNKIGKISLLKREEEIDLACKVKEGEKAFKLLVESNLRFVVNIASKFKGCGLSFSDLINEGNIGLMQAARKFDPDRGVKFVSYAVWWIKQSIIQALADQTGAVKIPVRQIADLNKIGEQFDELIQKLGREPNVNELAKAINRTNKEVEYLLLLSRNSVSLENPISDDNDATFLDFLEADNLPSVDEEIDKAKMEQDLQELLNSLKPKEAEVLRRRFGLDGSESETLEEIGNSMNLSRERIRQIEEKAKKTIKKMGRSHLLKDFLR
ncbi:MAG: RNA polymerase sigma factor RpoD/SigA [Candidatus Schekmanbacteria bacterium]|nr:RNA polymerase sigma factor RpoD/SigA [Candidatus Schekmanbacteria bacterium]